MISFRSFVNRYHKPELNANLIIANSEKFVMFPQSKIAEPENLVFEPTSDMIKLVAWRIDQLVLNGSFDTSYAGQLSAIRNLDYRQAISLQAKGATQQQVLDILIEDE